MPQQRSSPTPPRGNPQPPVPPPSRFTIRIGEQTFTGDGATRLEAFAHAVQQAQPLLREALRTRQSRTARHGRAA